MTILLIAKLIVFKFDNNSIQLCIYPYIEIHRDKNSRYFFFLCFIFPIKMDTMIFVLTHVFHFLLKTLRLFNLCAINFSKLFEGAVFEAEVK